MQKSFFTAVILLLLSASAYAQFSLSGVVKGSNNDPLAGATIQLLKTNRFTVSDDFGKFHFAKLPAGEYNLLVKYLGYADTLTAVTVNGNTDVTLEMKEAPEMTEQVVVESTRATNDIPATFMNINRQAIQKQNFGQDLPYLLNWTPSLVTTSDAGTGVGYTGLRIRGSDATRINVTINGIPYNDSESLGTYWVDIPDIASSSQSIQIQRGVGTSTNGAGAFGGSVNVQTNTLNSEPYAQVTTSAGSFNTRRATLNAGTGLLNDHWSFDGRISTINSDGYIDRASSELNSYYLSGGYYGKKSIWKALAFGGHEKTYQSWYGIDPDMMKTDRTFNYAGAIYDDDWNVIRYYNNQVDDYKQDHVQLHFSQALTSQTTLSLALHYTHGRGYYEEYTQDVPFAAMGLNDIVLNDTTLTASDFITRKWLDNHFYGSTFSINHSTEKFDLIVGGGYHNYSPAKHYGEIIWAEYAANTQIRQRYYEGTSDKSDFNIYSKLNYEFTGTLHGFIDLQYRTVHYKTAGTDDTQAPYAFDDEFNFFNPKAGLVYALTDQNQLYISYAIAHREPTRTDYLDGDTKPKAEQLGNLEAGWRKSTDHLQLEVNYYLMSYKNQLVLTGELDNVGYPIRKNVGKSFRTGIEFTGTLRFSNKVSWSANATWSQNKNVDFVWLDENDQPVEGTTTIILSPDWIAGSQFTWNPLPAFQASLLSKYVSKQYLDNTENDALSLDGYFINDVRLSYGFSPRGTKGIEAGLLINNLFDVAYSSNGYSYDGVPYVYPQAGRNYMIMLNLKF